MKIAILNIYQDSVSRGAETFVKELTQRLTKKHKVDIISDKKATPQSQTKPKVIWRFFIDKNSLSIFKFTLKNLKRIYREKYDIVIPLNGGWQPALVRFTTWLYGGKMVISGQSGIGWDDINNLWCFPNAFIALSSYAAHWAKAMNPLVNVVYIPNGVNTKKFTPQGQKYNHGLKSPVILTVAALTKTKRIDLTIKAVAKTNNLSLLICGKGEEKENLKKLGEKLLGAKRFKMIEADFENLPPIYRSASLFSHVSESYYAFEIVLLEAMASGIPVVANQDPIRAEIVGEGGLLVDPTDTKNYVLTLKKALSRVWKDLPRKQALKFDWDTVSDKYDQLFRKILK